MHSLKQLKTTGDSRLCSVVILTKAKYSDCSANMSCHVMQCYKLIRVAS